jgi:hypothetical protein
MAWRRDSIRAVDLEFVMFLAVSSVPRLLLVHIFMIAEALVCCHTPGI